jgi:hypothetical protein
LKIIGHENPDNNLQSHCRRRIKESGEEERSGSDKEEERRKEGK